MEVDLEEGLIAPLGNAVNGVGHHFLAGAALPLEEDGRVRVCGPPHDIFDHRHVPACPEEELDVGIRRVSYLDVPVGRLEGARLVLGQRTLERAHARLSWKRLDEKVCRTRSDGADHQPGRVRAGHCQGDRVRGAQGYLLEHPEAFVAQFVHVHQGQRGPEVGQERKCLGPRPGDQGGIPGLLNSPLQRLTALGIAI